MNVYQYDLNKIDRFRQTQSANNAYDSYIQEIENRHAPIPWKWFIFPCFDEKHRLFHTDIRFIKNKAEAISYWSDLTLKQRLYKATHLILQRDTHDAFDIFGSPDYLLVHSSMTLFFMISHDAVFQAVIDKLYGGILCEYTMRHTEPKWKLATGFFIRKI